MIMVLRLPCKINQASDPLHHLRASRSLTCRSNHNLITTNFSCSIRNSKCHRRPCNDSSSKSLHPIHQLSRDVIHHIDAQCSNLNDVKDRCLKNFNYMAMILSPRFNIYTFQMECVWTSGSPEAKAWTLCLSTRNHNHYWRANFPRLKLNKSSVDQKPKVCSIQNILTCNINIKGFKDLWFWHHSCIMQHCCCWHMLLTDCW